MSRNSPGAASLDLDKAGSTADKLCELLREHGSRQQVAEFGCWRAQAMAAESMQSRAALVEAGGADVLVATIQSHRKLLAIQEDGCGALASIAAGDDTCRAALVSADCVRVRGLGSCILRALGPRAAPCVATSDAC